MAAMTEARCETTDLYVSQCAHCQNRPGSIDLNPPPGAGSQGTGYAREVVKTVEIGGESYGLVPSGGKAYTFGSGHGLHHRRECPEGVDTPAERVQELDDPNDDLYLVVKDPTSQVAAGRVLRNIDGGKITAVCGLCALRPITY